MDKKAKKRIKVLRKKLEALKLKLAGAKQQEDEPGEVQRREAAIEAVLDEMRRLKSS